MIPRNFNLAVGNKSWQPSACRKIFPCSGGDPSGIASRLEAQGKRKAGAKPTRQNSSLSEAPLTGVGKSAEVQTDETGHEMVFGPIPGILSTAKGYLRRSTASEEAKKNSKRSISSPINCEQYIIGCPYN
jgi:hypothetical protein